MHRFYSHSARRNNLALESAADQLKILLIFTITDEFSNS